MNDTENQVSQEPPIPPGWPLEAGRPTHEEQEEEQQELKTLEQQAWDKVTEQWTVAIGKSAEGFFLKAAAIAEACQTLAKYKGKYQEWLFAVARFQGETDDVNVKMADKWIQAHRRNWLQDEDVKAVCNGESSKYLELARSPNKERVQWIIDAMASLDVVTRYPEPGETLTVKKIAQLVTESLLPNGPARQENKGGTDPELLAFARTHTGQAWSKLTTDKKKDTRDAFNKAEALVQQTPPAQATPRTREEIINETVSLTSNPAATRADPVEMAEIERDADETLEDERLARIGSVRQTPEQQEATSPVADAVDAVTESDILETQEQDYLTENDIIIYQEVMTLYTFLKLQKMATHFREYMHAEGVTDLVIEIKPRHMVTAA